MYGTKQKPASVAVQRSNHTILAGSIGHDFVKLRPLCRSSHPTTISFRLPIFAEDWMRESNVIDRYW